MSSFSELIKNFENVRAYMRDFYIYGFKSREEYNRKSARSYDNERRRVESWLGDYMNFVRTPEGKNVFISVDSRVSTHNPFYKALKAKSFTDGDITLHFVLFDILHSPEVILSLPEILEKIDDRLNGFQCPIVFDESTVRKKLKEYISQGIIVSRKEGRKLLYSRAGDIDLSGLTDVLDFYSEVAPCGVVGSFLLDKQDEKNDSFTFKHHYIASALDSDITSAIFRAMHEKSVITFDNLSQRSGKLRRNRIIPLKLFVSVQNGRQHLIGYQPDFNTMQSFRTDYISNVKIEEPTPRFDELRSELEAMKSNIWGVSTGTLKYGEKKTEHVDFTVKVEDNEEHIVRRLGREKRIGKIEKLDRHTYRFSADVYDACELIPWIRSFICRITEIHFSDRNTEMAFKKDIEEMYRIYEIEEAEE